MTVVLTALVGCEAPTAADVTGVYLESRPGVRVVLSLQPDQTFTESVEAVGRQTVTFQGRWSYRRNDGVLSLEGAMYPLEDALHPGPEGGRKASGLWLLSVERGIGGIRLVDSPDLGFVFHRK
jgi:hypothetical protein